MGKRKQNGVDAFIAANGGFDRSDVDIKSTKALYWKLYKKEWFKSSKAQLKYISIGVNRDKHAVLSAAAKKHKRSFSKFVVEAALAYILERYVVPDIERLLAIRQTLALLYDRIQQLLQASNVSVYETHEILDRLFQEESKILSALQHPPKFHVAIKDLYQTDTEFKKYIDNLKNISNDYQNNVQTGQ